MSWCPDFEFRGTQAETYYGDRTTEAFYAWMVRSSFSPPFLVVLLLPFLALFAAFPCCAAAAFPCTLYRLSVLCCCCPSLHSSLPFLALTNDTPGRLPTPFQLRSADATCAHGCVLCRATSTRSCPPSSPPPPPPRPPRQWAGRRPIRTRWCGGPQHGL